MTEQQIVINADYVLQKRRALRLSQFRFWAQFGVTQSRGSRYESGWSIPVSVRRLVWLRYEVKISNEIWAQLETV